MTGALAAWIAMAMLVGSGGLLIALVVISAVHYFQDRPRVWADFAIVVMVCALLGGAVLWLGGVRP